MFSLFRKLFNRRKKLEKYDIDDYGGLGGGLRVSLNLDHPEVKSSIMYRLNQMAQYDIVNGKLVKKKNARPVEKNDIDGLVYYHREMIKKYDEGYDVDAKYHRRMLDYYLGEDR